jgi:eukaryotic-like serine/threonine-protein kinase
MGCDERAIAIVRQVCLALEAARAEGVVHSDLKSQTVVMDRRGRAWVMEFGLARSLRAPTKVK